MALTMMRPAAGDLKQVSDEALITSPAALGEALVGRSGTRIHR